MPRVRNLKAARYSPEYQQRLDQAYDLFTAYVGRQPPHLQLEWPSRSLLANALLVGFVQELYEKDKVKNLGTARHGILAVQKRHRRLRGRLSEAWETVTSWGLERPGALRTPILLPVVLALSALSKAWALGTSGLDSYLWFAVGVLAEVGFFGLLRPKELLGLRLEDVSFPEVLLSLAERYGIGRIDNPKNRRQFGRVQFAVIRSEHSTAWLQWLSRGLLQSDFFWPSTAAEYRKRFKQLVSALGLDAWGLLPSSLRPGGATWFFAHGVEPPRLQFWGRWASPTSLGHYLQESVAKQLNMTAPAAGGETVLRILTKGSCFLNIPNFTWHDYGARHKNYKRQRVFLAQLPVPQKDAQSVWESLYPPPVLR